MTAMTPDLDPTMASLLAAAADAVAPVLPAAEPLGPGDPQPATEHVTALFAGAAVATLGGGLTGRIAVLVGQDLVDALKSSPLGNLDLAAAVQPALDAAAAALGGTADAGRQVDLDVVDAELGADLWAVPLIGMTISGALLVPSSVLANAAGVELPEPEPEAVEDGVEAEPAAETAETAESVVDAVPAEPILTSQAPAVAAVPETYADDQAYDDAYDDRALPGRPAPLPLPPTARLRPVAGGRGIEMLHGVEMEVTVELGRTRMPVRDLLALAPGAVLELDRAAGSPADLLVNGRLIARGEVVVVDEDFGLRVTEIIIDESAAS